MTTRSERVEAVREHRLDGREGLGEVRRAEQRVEVGADREERDVAQVEQARVAHHDVQPEREQHVEQRDVGDAHPGVALGLQHSGSASSAHGGDQKQDDLLAVLVMACSSGAVRHALAEQARGTHVSMRISMMKAKMSLCWLPSTPPVSAPM